MAALCLCVYGAEEVGGWVEESGVGERTRSPPSCSATVEITGQLGRKSPLSEEDPPPEPPASCPTDGALMRPEEARRLSGWRRLGGTEKKVLPCFYSPCHHLFDTFYFGACFLLLFLKSNDSYKNRGSHRET